jgi:hypothetical protein
MRAEHKQRGTADEKCQLCDQKIGEDTEKHLYIDCTHVAIDNCRREMVEDLRNIMESVSHDTPNQKNVISSLFNLLTESDDRHLLWKGIITPTQVQVINDALQWDTAEEYNIYRKEAILFYFKSLVIEDQLHLPNNIRSYLCSIQRNFICFGDCDSRTRRCCSDDS